MMGYFTFQCPKCFIISGVASRNPADAPYCCGGQQMMTIYHEGSEALLESVIGKVFREVRVDPDENRLVFAFVGGPDIYLFDDDQSCCETRWIHTDDDLLYFTGCKFLGLEVKEGPSEDTKYEFRDSQFLIIKTTLGEFTVVNYNQHNGHYAGFKIVARELDAEDV